MVIAVAVYLHTKIAHECNVDKFTSSYVTKHQYLTATNSSTHASLQTYGLFVHGQHDTSPTHSTNEDQRTAVIAIVVYLNSKIWTSKLLLWCMFGHHIIQDEITIETQVMN